MRIRHDVRPWDLSAGISRMWELSAAGIRSVEKTCSPGSASPVFTVRGRYVARGWTEWTQGFQYGSSALQFDATGERWFLETCRDRTLRVMASHLTHTGVHDHGFNNVSTYGNLRRLAKEGRFEAAPYEEHFHELALKVSGAVQAARWTPLPGGGYIHSFNGPHSLFVDTIRSLRALALAHRLGHVLMGEKDARISLLGRLIDHAHATARYAVWYGEGRDGYDVRGRTAHESVFNVTDGSYRCPSSQQGYSPFTTWTRGQAWAMLGFAEQLEFLAALPDSEFEPYGGRAAVTHPLLEAARATCDYWIEDTPEDGIPYWDNGAPRLHRLGDWRSRPADPFNSEEPVDSSAAAIACQGLIRLGRYLEGTGDGGRGMGERTDMGSGSGFGKEKGGSLAGVPSPGSAAVSKEDGGRRAEEGAAGSLPTPDSRLPTGNGNPPQDYTQAGLTVLARLLEEPYLSTDENHQGLLLHSIYHHPNRWDHVPEGRSVPCGESSQWGDYHLREAALLVQRMAENRPYLTFFGGDAG